MLPLPIAIPSRTLGLTLRAEQDLLGVLTGCVEQGSARFGLASPQAMNLTLGAEELFLKLCADQPGLGLEVALVQTATGVRLDLRARGAALDLRAFNLTASVSADLEDLGLFLAARLVDDLEVYEDPGGVLRVSLFKQRVYPPVEPLPARPAPDRVSVRSAEPAELQHFARLHAGVAPEAADFLRTPGLLADLVEAQELQARLAFGPQGEVAGGIFWSLRGRSAEGHGPCCFGTGDGVAAALLDACVGELARSQTLALFFLDPPPTFPAGHFETVGSLEGAAPCRFRMLHEDPGSVAWVHRDLEGWLRETCRRLALPRDIRLQSPVGERQAEHSVFFARLQRGQRRAELRPVRAGQDLAANLAAHLQRFQAEGLVDLRCPVDLGEAWQAAFIPALLEAGFAPRLLLPYRGRGDQVLFQKVTR